MAKYANYDHSLELPMMKNDSTAILTKNASSKNRNYSKMSLFWVEKFPTDYI